MIRRDGERLLVEGPVTFASAAGLLDAAAREARAGASVLDFAAATQTDSAALALALDLRRQAGAEGRAIRFVNMPEPLRKLAELYSVGDVVFGD